ncbi:UDP-N-acetylglucosamine transferase subunit ALG14 homolog isoform X3 [Gopherus evgoodei]|uniref:UDP-N-acetylglucosamine transferase subunit ALG14 homolog isoform X3 n=1 Tax=Gopherus evgoodei TaxID=1825980 RepID=UPI0011CEDF07|nr:UDP-N-acetylglucosamine transferase subunit ALG14 homolog isoform X3 [Gopherus evgoodei]
MDALPAVLGAAALLLLLLLTARLLLARRNSSPRTAPLSLLVVAGSGGHTTEILRLLSSLSQSYSPRHYIFADSDKMSEDKIRTFEQKRAETFSNSQFTLNRIPRCREVCQSWSSSVLTTLYSILYSFPLTFRLKPDLEAREQSNTIMFTLREDRTSSSKLGLQTDLEFPGISKQEIIHI